VEAPRQALPQQYPVTAHFQVQLRIFATASEQRSRIGKLILDSLSEHLLLLWIFDRTSGCRDIDCPKNSEFLAGT
jgi:hypothetical protein